MHTPELPSAPLSSQTDSPTMYHIHSPDTVMMHSIRSLHVEYVFTYS